MEDLLKRMNRIVFYPKDFRDGDTVTVRLKNEPLSSWNLMGEAVFTIDTRYTGNSPHSIKFAERWNKGVKLKEEIQGRIVSTIKQPALVRIYTTEKEYLWVPFRAIKGVIGWDL